MNTTDTELEEHLKKDRMKPAWKRAYEFYKPLGHEELLAMRICQYCINKHRSIKEKGKGSWHT
jgi:hypothetical protein